MTRIIAASSGASGTLVTMPLFSVREGFMMHIR